MISRWVAVAAFCALVGLGYAVLARPAKPEVVLGAYVTSLHGRDGGQRRNAETCLKKLNGTVIEAGETFSFNQIVGTWSRDAGYAKAPVSYGGQLIPFWGGGVCQTSSTVYNAALLAGLPIVQRHKHHFAPGYVAAGRDAAVAYPNIDLQFQNDTGAPIEVRGRVQGDTLLVELIGPRPLDRPVRIAQRTMQERQPMTLRTGSGSTVKQRNPGKAGSQVATYRLWPDREELLSVDSYPVMHRILEAR